MMPETESSGKERFTSVVQRKRQPKRMNGVQKKTQTIFFVNTNNNRKGVNPGGAEPEPAP
jgi:hypothetical protein